MSTTRTFFKRNNEIWILSNADVDTKKRTFRLVPIFKKPLIVEVFHEEDDTPSAHLTPTLPPASPSPTPDEDKP